MTLTTYPVPSASGDVDNFANFGKWCETIDQQVNTLSFSVISATSSTSLTVGGGSKTLTLAADVPFSIGMIVMVWNSSSNWMLGRVTSYTSGTKALIITVIDRNGSSTLASWTVSVHGMARNQIDTADNRIFLNGGTGFGSVNTHIRRYTTTNINVGTAITHTTNSTDGCSFTINEQGWYAIDVQDNGPAGGCVGLSKNSNQLTTSILSITFANYITHSMCGTTTNTIAGGGLQVIDYFSAGDVLRAHVNSPSSWAASQYVSFDILKI